ncbi:hypothetical protein EMIT036CA2_11231 [Chryseobacterium sp. IT-36CA2]
MLTFLNKIKFGFFELPKETKWRIYMIVKPSRIIITKKY